MIDDNAKPGSTLGADKNYDTSDFVAGCRERGCTPRVSQNNTSCRSAIDARTTRDPGYRIGSGSIGGNNHAVPDAPRRAPKSGS
jgi:hypothetical protein